MPPVKFEFSLWQISFAVVCVSFRYSNNEFTSYMVTVDHIQSHQSKQISSRIK